MVRFLVWWALILGLSWLFRQSFRKRPARSGTGRQMVRDRVCDTFLPLDRALLVQDKAGLHHFCSAACKEHYLALRARGKDPTARSAAAD